MTNKYAFFDLDETLIKVKSLLECFEFYNRHEVYDISDIISKDHSVLKTKKWISQEISKGVSRDSLNESYYNRYFDGINIEVINETAKQWYQSLDKKNLFRSDMISILNLCRVYGFTIVIISGSFREAVGTIANEIGVELILCTPLEEKDGFYTGKLTGRPMIGVGKRLAVSDFLASRTCSAEKCLGFGDDISDVPFLTYLGNAFYVDSGSESAEHWGEIQGLHKASNFSRIIGPLYEN